MRKLVGYFSIFLGLIVLIPWLLGILIVIFPGILGGVLCYYGYKILSKKERIKIKL
jgi:uncharacterized membrane protein